MTCNVGRRVWLRMDKPMGIYGGGHWPTRGESGFTLLWLLFLIVLLGLGLAALGKVWHTSEIREREKQLIFAGDQYRRALESYYRATPGQEKHYPKTLSDLLEDKRVLIPVRHLRRLYRDPLTNAEEWGLVKQGEEITGVYSLASGKPFKRAGFPRAYEGFEGKESYRDWVFAAFPKGLDQNPDGTADTAVIGGAGEGRVPSMEVRKQCDDALQLAEQACMKLTQEAQHQACIDNAVRAHRRCVYGK